MILNLTNFGSGGSAGGDQQLIAYYSLDATRWMGTDAPYTQTINITELAEGANAIIDLAMSATPDEFLQGAKAKLKPTNQDGADIEFSAFGVKPSINLPIQVILIGAGKAQVNATLDAESWQGTIAPYTQTLTLSGMENSSIVLIDLDQSISKESYDAAAAAGLKATQESNNSITISAFGVIPLINIPIQVLVLK